MVLPWLPGNAPGIALRGCGWTKAQLWAELLSPHQGHCAQKQGFLGTPAQTQPGVAWSPDH
jgi:hypothetical protein